MITIRKKFQGTVPDNKILNTDSTSVTDTYSCDKINSIIEDVENICGDVIPVDAMFEYDGDEVPDGYEIVEDKSSVNYSEEELQIGTWVDNKPLYRKVLFSSSKIEAVSEYIPDTIISDIDVVVNLDVTIGSFGDFCAKNHWSSNDYRISTQYDKNNGLYIDATYGGFIGWTLIIEYTKTTD